MDNKLDDIEILYFAICNQIGLYNSFLEDNKNNLSKEDIEFSEYIIARSIEIRDNMERNLILSIIDQSKELKSLELELSKTNNLGKRNSLIKSKVFKLKKLKHTMSTIDRIVNGNIITIRYSLDEQVFQRKFVNISKRDVILLLKLTNSNHKIKILEIKEEFTKESLIKL